MPVVEAVDLVREYRMGSETVRALDDWFGRPGDTHLQLALDPSANELAVREAVASE